MGKLVMTVLWTAAVLAGLSVALSDAAPARSTVAIVVLPIFAALGFLAIILSLLDIRRRRSLRRITENGVAVHVWTGLDGLEHRSTDDPTPGWDAEGSDGGGDGSGGD